MTSARDALRPGEWVPGFVTLKYLIGEFLLYKSSWRGELWGQSLVGVSPSAMQQAEDEGWALPRDVPVRYVSALPLSTTLPTVTARGRILRYVPRRYHHASTDLTVPLDEYWEGFSSKSRGTIRRKVRKLREALGEEFRFVIARSPGEVAAFYQAARAVSSQTYQEKLLDAGLPAGTEYQAGIAALAATGDYFGFLIYDGARPIAYMACPAANAVVLYEYVGFDPSYRHLSPGTVLLVLALEYLFSVPHCSTFDFTAGEAEHKRTFASRLTPCVDAYYFHRTLSTSLLIMLHRGVSRLSAAGVWVANKAGIKDRLKRLVRRRASVAPHNDR